MKSKILVLFFLQLLIFIIHLPFGEAGWGRVLSQPVQQEWVRTFHGTGGANDFPSALVADTEGNIYITGGIFTQTQNTNYCTIKYNTSGDQQWVSFYNGPGSNSIDIATAIAVDKQENVYVTGYSEQTGLGADAYCTIKYNKNGVQQWAARYKYLPNLPDDPTAIAVDSLGNVFVTGHSQVSLNGYEWCTIKYNQNGDSLWVKRFHYTDLNSSNWAYSLVLDKFNNVYVTGSTSMGLGIIKYNSSGIQQWINIIDSSRGRRIVLDDTGNCYVSGSKGIYYFLTAKFNTNGIKQWATMYNGYQCNASGTSGMGINPQGDIFITGALYISNSYPDVYGTIKYNNSGVQQWANIYYDTSANSLSKSNGLSLDNDRNVYITGTVSGPGIGSNGTEFRTIKYDNTGTQKWLMRYAGGGQAIALDKNNSVIVFGGGINYDSGVGYCTIKYDQLVDINNKSENISKTFQLNQNFPNPFNPSTKIKFSIPLMRGVPVGRGVLVSLNIYDVLGREVSNLVNEKLQPGSYEIKWDGSNYPSGVYFYKITITDTEKDSGLNYSETKKLILIK